MDISQNSVESLESIGGYKWQDESVLSIIDTTEKPHSTCQQLASKRGISTGKLPSTLTEALKPIDSRDKIAKIAGLSHDTIAKIKSIEASAPVEVKEKLREIGKEKQKQTLKQGDEMPVLSTMDKTEESHNTRQQLASKLNIGTGTLARGEVVAKNASEEFKRV